MADLTLAAFTWLNVLRERLDTEAMSSGERRKGGDGKRPRA
jgi:hypothetical protein